MEQNPNPPETEVQPQVETPSKPVAEKSNYVVPEKEKNLFHVEVEPKNNRFNSQTGKKNHIPFVQKYHPRDFAFQIQPNDKGEPIFSTLGWRFNKILHRPADSVIEGVKVDIGGTKENGGRKTFISLAEMLDRLDVIIKNQPA